MASTLSLFLWPAATWQTFASGVSFILEHMRNSADPEITDSKQLPTIAGQRGPYCCRIVLQTQPGAQPCSADLRVLIYIEFCRTPTLAPRKFQSGRPSNKVGLCSFFSPHPPPCLAIPFDCPAAAPAALGQSCSGGTIFVVLLRRRCPCVNMSPSL